MKPIYNISYTFMKRITKQFTIQQIVPLLYICIYYTIKNINQTSDNMYL